jgi:hypothetical protein
MDKPVYPTIHDTSIPAGAVCQETYGMIGGNYLRCGKSATAIVKHAGRDEGPYYMCRAHATHNVEHRGGKYVCSLYEEKPEQMLKK